MTPTIPEIMQKMARVFAADQAQNVDAVVHFKFTGAEAGEWNAVIHDGKCQVAQGIPRSRPTISLVADSGDFIGVVAGELDGMQAFMEGKLKVTGDVRLAPELIKLFRVA